MTTYAQFVHNSTVSKEVLDVFLSETEPSWARFDPEVGYVLGNYMPRDGIDNSLTISTTSPDGARRAVIYAERPCRLNTYGDSFTHCHQVSDHETWQEYLAAHLGEPIRNFGMGGFGVYQAYRRLIRNEISPDGADYVILYIWGDDHIRSLLRCRYVLTQGWHRAYQHLGGRMFHGNFWSNIELDLENGQFVERENMLPTPESLYKMTDGDFMVDALRDDLMLQMSLFCHGETEDVDIPRLNQLAAHLDRQNLTELPAENLRLQVEELRQAYAFAATQTIIERTETFAAAHNKQLMVALFCPNATRQLITTGRRYDQPIVDFLQDRGIRYFDMNVVHADDFKQFNLSVDDYLKRYLSGHYSPAGNHFFAFAIKDAIVDWLDPKPVTYLADNQAQISFERDYLPNQDH